MFTIRPNLRAIIPSTVSLIMNTAPSMLPLRADIQVARSQSRKLPVGGPPELLTTMSGSGTDLEDRRPPLVAVDVHRHGRHLGAGGGADLLGRGLDIGLRAGDDGQSTPSRANDIAHAFPSPALAPPTMAFLPAIPKSIRLSPSRSRLTDLFLSGDIFFSAGI